MSCVGVGSNPRATDDIRFSVRLPKTRIGGKHRIVLLAMCSTADKRRCTRIERPMCLPRHEIQTQSFTINKRSCIRGAVVDDLEILLTSGFGVPAPGIRFEISRSDVQSHKLKTAQ